MCPRHWQRLRSNPSVLARLNRLKGAIAQKRVATARPENRAAQIRAEKSYAFHDIHDRAGKVLPVLIPRLRAEGYRFAGLDANGELVNVGPP